MHSSALLITVLPALVAAVNLWASSYAGNITTLSLTATKNDTASSYALAIKYVSNDCLNNPSWLHFDPMTRILYCAGEGFNTPTAGTLSTFKIQSNGSLTQTNQVATLGSPVNAVQYSTANGSQYLALAHYGGSAVSTWSLQTPTAPTQSQSLVFTLPKPGANPGRQTAPHPHQVILDPTKKYILSPDLGADLIRVFSIDAKSGLLAPCANVTVAPGSGPRHATFATPPSSDPTCDMQSKPVLYLVSELANTVTAFNVSYPSTGCLALDAFETGSSFGPTGGPATAAVAEILFANDHLLVSNRADLTFPATPTSNASDSLAVFSLASNGEFDFQQLAPAGGGFPRSLAINKAGDLVAVGLQYGNEVAIFSRSMANGSLQKMVARASVPGNVTCVVWDE